MKKAVSILLSVCLIVFCLCGCSKEKSNGNAVGGSATVIDDTLKNLEKVENLYLEAKTDSTMSFAGQSVTTVSDTTGEVDVKNGVQHLTISMAISGQKSDVESYFSLDKDGADVYIKTMGMWMKQTGISEENVKKLGLNTDSYDLMSEYIKCLKDKGELTEETDKYILSGKINVAEDGILETLGLGNLLDQLTQSGIPADKVDEILANAGNLTMKITIDKKNLLPGQIEIDVTEVTQNIMDGLATELGQAEGSIKVEKSVTVSKYSKYNEVAQITIPDEALNGQETTLVQ